MHSQTMFIAGHARLPEGMAAKNVYDMLTITVEIDKRFAVILEGSCTLATEHGRDFVGRLLRGYSLQNGVEELIQHVKENYCGKAIHAIVAALSDLHFQYQQLKMVR